MSTLYKLEDLVGKEYFVTSAEYSDFYKHAETNTRQANNNRIVELVLNTPVQSRTPGL